MQPTGAGLRERALALANELVTLASANERNDDRSPIDLDLTAGGYRVRLQIRPALPDALSPAEEGLIEIVRGAGGWITTSAILSVMSRRGLDFCEDTTAPRILTRLVKAGLLVSSRKAPRGYKLPDTPAIRREPTSAAASELPCAAG